MLLNRVLTVQAGVAGSHRGKGWEAVTERAIRALVARDTPLVAILWGRDAGTLRPAARHDAGDRLGAPEPAVGASRVLRLPTVQPRQRSCSSQQGAATRRLAAARFARSRASRLSGCRTTSTASSAASRAPSPPPRHPRLVAWPAPSSRSRAHQAVRFRHRGQRPELHGRAGSGYRLPRSERGGQDHDPAQPARPGAADQRHGHLRWPPLRANSSSRCRWSAPRSRRRASTRAVAVAITCASRRCRRHPVVAGRRGARLGRSGRRRTTPGRRLLARDAAAARSRLRPARRPGALVLDEPINGLDPEGIRWIRGFLRELAGRGTHRTGLSHLLSRGAADSRPGGHHLPGPTRAHGDPRRPGGGGRVHVDGPDRAALARRTRPRPDRASRRRLARVRAHRGRGGRPRPRGRAPPSACSPRNGRTRETSS